MKNPILKKSTQSRSLLLILLLSLFSFLFSSCSSLYEELSLVTITYHSDKGKEIKEKQVEKGYVLKDSDLPPLSYPKYTFLGWYDKNENKIISGKYKVNNDITFYALWKKEKEGINEDENNTQNGESTSSQNEEIEQVMDVIIKGGDENAFIDYLDPIYLSTNTKGCSIYYTTDGTSIPPVQSFLYDPLNPPLVNVKDSITIKAIAYKDGMAKSNVVTKTFNIKKYNVTFSDGENLEIPQNITGLLKGDELTKDNLALNNPLPPIPSSRYVWKDTDGNIIKEGHKVTKDLALTLFWITNPYEVTNLKASPLDKGAVLLWNNPEDKDLSKIVIEGDNNFTPIELPLFNKPFMSYEKEIRNLQNNIRYTFSLTAYDKEGQKSESKTITVVPSPLKDTNKEGVKILPLESEGSNGKKATYVEFGMWPQRRCDPIKENIDTTTLVNFRGWEAYQDDKGNYYVKEKTKPLFKQLGTPPYFAPHNDVNYPFSYYTFKDGEKVIEGEEYYYKIEKIKWKVLSNTVEENGKVINKKLLVSENALTSLPYCSRDTSVTLNIDGKMREKNNYEYSDIRAFLNGLPLYKTETDIDNTYVQKGFIDKAFSEEEKSYIESNTLSTREINGDAVTDILTDKVFILNLEDITNPSLYNSEENRCVYQTDYAMSKGAFSYMGKCTYWVRVDESNSEYNEYITEDGETNRVMPVNNTSVCVVPALTISFSEN